MPSSSIGGSHYGVCPWDASCTCTGVLFVCVLSCGALACTAWGIRDNLCTLTMAPCATCHPLAVKYCLCADYQRYSDTSVRQYCDAASRGHVFVLCH